MLKHQIQKLRCLYPSTSLRLQDHLVLYFGDNFHSLVFVCKIWCVIVHKLCFKPFKMSIYGRLSVVQFNPIYKQRLPAINKYCTGNPIVGLVLPALVVVLSMNNMGLPCKYKNTTTWNKFFMNRERDSWEKQN